MARGSPAQVTVLSAAVGVLALAASGCATPERREAVPQDLTLQATIPDIPDARFYWDADPAPLLEIARESLEREIDHRESLGQEGPQTAAQALAISGGSDNGAFGAGLLLGWSAAGDRPQFKLVTGVSTGALAAPFAFLGPAYDEQLKEVFTTVTADDIFELRGLSAALFDDALADTGPLWALVSRYATQELLTAIADEYAKGRLLLIGTTNLDARRPVIWNMGAIAASDAPGALKLFRSILIASAAVPGAFPPVMIDVEVGGLAYQEMHVDGGAMTQVFVYPANFKGAKEIAKARGKRSIYVIRNARLDPDWASVERLTLDIVGRAILSLIHTQGIGDIYQIYLLAERDGIDFNLAFIPADFHADNAGEFNQVYMNALFDYGYVLAKDGYQWHKLPPGYATVTEQ